MQLSACIEWLFAEDTDRAEPGTASRAATQSARRA